MSFFGNALGGNPFSTPVGSKIEQATDDSLASENWSLNMEICDLVNETEDGPRDAVKALRKRLTQNAGKNYIVVMFALTVLETCVKNCGKRFHVLISNKDFLNELVKLIGPKNDPPTAVQEKVLSLIQSWADAFRNQPDMAGAVSVYNELLAKGIEFPATDLDAMAPIHTPEKSVEPIMENQQPSPTQTHAASPGVLNPDQRAKLQSELDVIQSNMNVFGEMLGELKSGREQTDELELLQELHATCQSMQERLMELISKLANDELTAELLRINDDLNNLFLRYSRWEKNRDTSKHPSASAVLAKAIPPPVQKEDSLIDFGEDLPEQLSKLSTAVSAVSQLPSIQAATAKNGIGKGDDEFDMFAQSRNVTYESSKTSGSTYKDNINPDQIRGGLSTAARAKQAQNQNPADQEFDEMAEWLGQTTGGGSGGGEESVTSSEFERFLAERAAAAEQLPNVDRTAPAKDEKGLFAL